MLAEAKAQLESYLQSRMITAQIEVREEGAFMLGAYPRSEVLWSIRIRRPDSAVDQSHLDDIALAASCLRSGWVWLNIKDGSGERKMLSYSTEDLQRIDNHRF